ncbi:hypothetical protein FPT15_13575 [Pseudomonas sp. RGB]|nr:hypothetical protein FPT15_13575 [Pseudomonas sp. RGB]
MLEMAQGAAKLGQGGEDGAQDAQKQEKQDPMKMLMDMLSKAAGGSQGGSAEDQKGPQELEKLMAGRQGMEAMMPADDSSRKIEV